MARVVDCCYESTGRPGFICDFSPPRSGSIIEARRADIPADFISVAYNPGRAVRANSAMLAAAIRRETGKETIFTLATRDMNRLAIQSLLLGAQVLGLENVVVVQGDQFNDRDRALLAVNGYRPTELIAGIRAMNEGTDFRGSNLREPTAFCIGATFDLSRGIEGEAELAVRKVEAGTDFLMSQPIFDPDGPRLSKATRQQAVCRWFRSSTGCKSWSRAACCSAAFPMACGRTEGGRSGVDIAVELHQPVPGRRATQRLPGADPPGWRAGLRGC